MATATVLFQWQDTYSVGIAQIDLQHKGLIKLINDMHSAMQAGKAKEAMGSIIDELIVYPARHPPELDPPGHRNARQVPNLTTGAQR